MAATVKFHFRAKPAKARKSPGSNRVGKQHRPIGDPVEYLKSNPKFEAAPFGPPAGNLVMSLDAVAAGVSAAIAKEKQMVFHTVGDTGGVNGTETQDSVAKAMEQQIRNPGVNGSPAFFYHLGDVVYFNGISTDYPQQFFEPYQYYPALIFAIPGNHDGDTHVRNNDKPDPEPSLTGFRDNFCAAPGTHASPYRDAMTQPYVYWTLDTPLATIVGLYSNIDGMLDAKDHGPQEAWLTQQMKDAAGDKCLIVAVHHAPYSLDVTHGGYFKILESLDNAIAASKRVPDMVLSGHVHNYQRFSRQIGDRTIPYIIAGAGGYANTPKAMHKLQTEGGQQFQLPFQTTHPDLTLQKFNQTDPGFLKVTVTPGELTAEYYIVPFEGSANGNPYDSVTVTLG
ncbi:MAG TPA: metallophosphoesterase [Terriglobia bacterium]|nr:metallophosphoesterase [Terriglobia bacterium]